MECAQDTHRRIFCKVEVWGKTWYKMSFLRQSSCKNCMPIRENSEQAASTSLVTTSPHIPMKIPEEGLWWDQRMSQSEVEMGRIYRLLKILRENCREIKKIYLLTNLVILYIPILSPTSLKLTRPWTVEKKNSIFPYF